MTTPQVELIFKDVWWRSKLDEESFFAWLEKIAAVRNIFGQGRDIIIQSDPAPIDDDALIELVALFSRYGVPTRQLDVYLTDGNRSWFGHEKAYWRQAKVS
jgi:hypothetical protein